MQRKRIEIETTDGTAWLDRLTPRMMIAIGDRVWSEKRKRLIDDLKDAEVDSANRIVALRELDNSRGMMSEVVGYAVTPFGALEIIEEASKGKNSEKADGLPDNFVGTSEDVIKIALELVAAELSKPEDDKKPTKKK